ncbi:hypothetical protein PMZ80_005612 [Knufia obscura]|uniref:Site-specific DNA-methyltransferase (adenine-specific) n=1 Tax=Knufia obscura TaxID=1635080 RepID=A0ABR0RN60_9EURO|nr:hypothetical protein PMZ80_005612 [Knufia obscura]
MKETILEERLGITADWEVDRGEIWRRGSQADKILRSWIRRRTRSEPLQYILGTQPFGELEIRCKPGVLIPRPETEAYTTEVAASLQLVRTDGDEDTGISLFEAHCGALKDKIQTSENDIDSIHYSILCMMEDSSNINPLYRALNSLHYKLENSARAVESMSSDLKDLELDIRKHQTRQSYPLTIADFCTGTGCIALLLHSLLRSPPDKSPISNLRVRAFDISQGALSLSTENLEHNINLGALHPSARKNIAFENLDVLALSRLPQPEIQKRLFSNTACEEASFDVIVSNPPYISPSHFRPGGPTTRSVRKFEPQLALVPPAELAFPHIDRADQFYVALLRIAAATRCKLLVMEVGDTAQAERMVELCQRSVEHGIRFNIFGEDEPGDELGDCPVILEVFKDDGDVVNICEDGSTIGDLHNPEGVQCRAVIVWFDDDWNHRRMLEDEAGFIEEFRLNK